MFAPAATWNAAAIRGTEGGGTRENGAPCGCGMIDQGKPGLPITDLQDIRPSEISGSTQDLEVHEHSQKSTLLGVLSFLW
jgi:hypothetical protein